ncbi:MAG: lytic murein transglycosylase, partial [Pseudomonadota bacterium]
MSSPHIASLAALCLVVSACSDTADGQSLTPNGSVVNAPSETGQTAPRPANFDEWKRAFRPRAIGNGISPGVFDQALSGVTPNPRVLELDRFQPEFTRPIWEYLDGAVSD